jgi:O-antigen ligase
LQASIIICFISSTFVFSFLFFDNIQNLFNNFLNSNFRIIYDDLLHKKIFNHHFPRSTGISRTFGLINIFVIIYFLFCAKKKKIKYLLYTISFIYTSLIWLLQSRGSILIFSITIFIIIFFLKKIKIIKRFFLILIFLFLPIILTELMISYTKNLVNDNLPAKNLANDNLSEKKLTNFNNKFEYFVKRNRVITDSTSSGRIAIWKDSFAKYDKNKIFGYGPQGDRFLLEKSESLIQYSNNSSNALIYSLLSGGYFGITVMLLVYLKILIQM